MKFYLDDERQGFVAFQHAWAKCLDALKVGKQFEVEIKYKNRSNEQNKKFHAILRDIAQQSQHMGSKWDADDWKRLLVWQFCKEKNINSGKVVPSLDMTGVVQLGQQTRSFTKEQASEFVDFLTAWCAEHGVTLNDAQKVQA